MAQSSIYTHPKETPRWAGNGRNPRLSVFWVNFSLGFSSFKLLWTGLFDLTRAVWRILTKPFSWTERFFAWLGELYLAIYFFN